MSALTGVKAILDLVNEAVPTAVSYLVPQAGRSEYYVQWATPPGARPYIVKVSERPLPVAEFAYAQRRDFRVELDGTKSEGNGLRFECMWPDDALARARC